jgi:hypothetical protein
MTKERPQEPSGWITARRYTDTRSALRAYESARDLLLIDQNLKASVLRFTLNGVSYVAALGDAPLDARQERLIEYAMDAGEIAELPPFVINGLRARREQVTELGLDYVERRRQPG